jgi:hypothetical protein
VFDRAIAEFAADYADQNERDYAALLDAIASGRVEAQTGLCATVAGRTALRAGRKARR